MTKIKIKKGDQILVTLDEDREYYHLHAGQRILGKVLEILPFSHDPLHHKGEEGAKIILEKISGLKGPQILQIFSEEWETAEFVPEVVEVKGNE